MFDSPSFLQNKRVLVVEDREENRRLLRAILKLEGAQILEASGGLEGVAMAGSQKPDLVLMDLHMPEVDGLAATRMLRQDSQTRALFIVFVTASAGEATRREIMEAGGDGFLTKPLDPLQLAAQIEAILCPHARKTPQKDAN